MRALILALLLSGCVSLRSANRAALGAQTASLVCDWAQTRRAASAGWAGQREQNPLLGRYPAPATVDGYFIAATALAALAWYATPRRWRMVTSGTIVAHQSYFIVDNMSARRVDLGLCGIR